MQSLAINHACFLPESLPKIRNYLEVGRWLHLIALVSALFSIYFFNLAMEGFWLNDLTGKILYSYLSFHFSTILFFSELDARSRYQNYKWIRDLLYRYGYRERFFKSLIHSKCQREAAILAAKELSYSDEVINFFHQSGYRWYHIFPDCILTNPEYLLTKHFWLTTFFTKTYSTKYFKK